MDSRAPAVNPVIRADVGAALLTSASLRRFLLCVTFALACYYANGVLYNDCDMNEPGDFANRRVTTLFENTAAATAKKNHIYSVNCTNSTNHPYTYTFNASNDVKFTYYERDVFRCLREDKHGRENISTQMYTMMAFLGVIIVAMIVALAMKIQAGGRQAVTGLLATALYGLNIFIFLTSLLSISNRLFFAYKAEGDNRDLDYARWMLKLSAYWSVGSGSIYTFLYFVALILSVMQVFGSSISKQTISRLEKISATTITSGGEAKVPRRMRADTVMSTIRHEFLTMAVLAGSMALVLYAAKDLHDESPGKKLFQIVHGEGIVGGTTDFVENGVKDGVWMPLFNSNTTCLADRPFTMNVSMHDTILSTQHHLKNHMEGHGKGGLAIFILVIVFLSIEVLWSIWAYMKVSSKLMPSDSKDKSIITDALSHIIPLVSHLISTFALTIAITLFNMVVFYVFQQRSKHHLTQMEDTLMASGALAVVATALEFAQLVIYGYHATTASAQAAKTA
jgi:hypothetical protein